MCMRDFTNFSIDITFFSSQLCTQAYSTPYVCEYTILRLNPGQNAGLNGQFETLCAPHNIYCITIKALSLQDPTPRSYTGTTDKYNPN